MIFRTEHLNEMSMEIAGFPYKPQMYKQERFLILVGTCKFLFAIVSFPSISTFTDVLFSTFVLKTGSSIETWGAYHLTEKSGWGGESIMVSNLPVYRRNVTSVTV